MLAVTCLHESTSSWRQIAALFAKLRQECPQDFVPLEVKRGVYTLKYTMKALVSRRQVRMSLNPLGEAGQAEATSFPQRQA
eukprot:6455970-Amphidinium_carterae.1